MEEKLKAAAEALDGYITQHTAELALMRQSGSRDAAAFEARRDELFACERAKQVLAAVVLSVGDARRTLPGSAEVHRALRRIESRGIITAIRNWATKNPGL